MKILFLCVLAMAGHDESRSKTTRAYYEPQAPRSSDTVQPNTRTGVLLKAGHLPDYLPMCITGSGTLPVSEQKLDHCANERYQRWFFVPDGKGRYTIRLTRHKYTCLTPPGAREGNDAPLFQSACKDADYMKWTVHPSPKAGHFYLRNAATGKCANVKNADTGPGSKIVQWDCVASENGYWALQDLDAYYNEVD